MKINFTEFSYGYAFTENLIRSSRSGPTTAPVFPNLVQEAQLGYDVKIDLPGIPLFFQFKLPEIMVRDTAREISQLALPGLSVPFFRMPLMRRDLSDQHKHMIGLEGKFPNTVFYATPEIDNSTAFNEAYGRADVHACSAFFSPSNIGPLPNDKNHVVAYSANCLNAWFCSDPEKINKLGFDTIFEITNKQLSQQSESTIKESIKRVRDDISPLFPRELRQSEPDIRNRIAQRRPAGDGSLSDDDRIRSVSTEILVLRELARVGLGVDLLIAQPRNSQKKKK